MLTKSDQIASAPIVRPVYAAEADWGKFMASVDTRQLGLAVVDLGGGRTKAGQRIDHAVGCTHWMRCGQGADGHTPLAVVHARTESDFQRAEARIRQAFEFDEATQPVHSRVVIEHRTA